MEKSLISWKDAFTEESESRINLNADKLCCYGIKPLDDALACIQPNELVVIGADSGVGKSEMGINIARANAKKGKKVVVYYLEGGHREAMQRMKYRDLTETYFKNFAGERIDIDFTGWSTNRISDPKGILNEVEKIMYKDYMEAYKDNLYFGKIHSEFTIDTFRDSLFDRSMLVPGSEKAKYGFHSFDIDLIIIDHLQYFSLPAGENEIKSITTIIRAVKQLTEMERIPVVLMSHLRKKTIDRGIPDQEDFYGSSNIPKISSTSILIAPDYENDNFSKSLFPTYLRIAKSRVGVRPSLLIKVDFDSIKRKYADDYDMHLVNRKGEVSKKALDFEKLPIWARKGKLNKINKDVGFTKEEPNA